MEQKYYVKPYYFLELANKYLLTLFTETCSDG